MKSIKKEIDSLEFSLETILKKKLFNHEQQRFSSLDYKKKEQEYYKKDVENKIKAIHSLMDDSSLKETFSELGSLIRKFDEDSIIKALEIIEDLKGKVKEVVIKEIVQNELVLPDLPKEIMPEVRANFDELLVCLENKCYRSVLILSGKILEIALHRKYFEVTGRDLLEKSPDIGLGNLLAKLRENNTYLDPGLSQQIHLINQLRVFSVHKKPEIFFPSKEQAKATVLYTLDILKKLFKK
jgi:hypothetical protein